MKIKFIDTTYLKNNTSIQGNVDDNILKNHIFDMQELYIKPILGTALYEKLKADVLAKTVSGIYKTILDVHIQRILANWTLYSTLPDIKVKITNKSTSVRTSEFSDPADSTDSNILRASARDLAEYYSNQLRKFLLTNKTDIPEFQNPGTTIDTIKPSDNLYFGGIWLG